MPRKKKEVVTATATESKSAPLKSTVEKQPETDINDGVQMCRICGREFPKRSKSVVQSAIKITIGERVIELKEGVICKECVTQIPNFLAGAIHLAFNVPKESFNRKFLYPPFNFSLEKPAPTKKRAPRKAKAVQTQDIVVESETTISSVDKNNFSEDKIVTEMPKRRRARQTIDERVEQHMVAKKEARRAARKNKQNTAT